MSRDYKSMIHGLEDWPTPGVVFRDVSPLLANWESRWAACTEMSLLALPYRPDVIVAIDARGFIFGTAVADTLRRGLVLARKPNKLPGDVIDTTYELEYGSNKIAMQNKSMAGQRVCIVDDVLATGGTMKAVASLVQELGGYAVSGITLVDIGIPGVHDFIPFPVHSLVQYGGKTH